MLNKAYVSLHNYVAYCVHSSSQHAGIIHLGTLQSYVPDYMHRSTKTLQPVPQFQTYTGPSKTPSAAHKSFAATWDHVPEAVNYGGQASVPKDIEYDIHNVLELEKRE